MATRMSYTPTADGLIFRLEGSTGITEVRMTRQEVTETVTNMCRSAGLPEPWKKG